MTPDELVTLTQTHVGNRLTASITVVWYLARVQSGYNRLATFQGHVNRPGMKQPQKRRLRFFELMDEASRTVLSTITNNFITNTAGVYSIDGIYNDTNGIWLEGWPARKMMHQSTSATGTLRYWTPSGKDGAQGYRIYKIPTVDTTLTEYIYKYPETLSAGGSAPVIPEEWHTAIHYAAGAEAADLLGQDGKSAELENKFLAFISERKSPFEETQARGGMQYYHIGRRRTARLGRR